MLRMVQLTHLTAHSKRALGGRGVLHTDGRPDMPLAGYLMGRLGPLNLRQTKRTYFFYYGKSPIIFEPAPAALRSLPQQKRGCMATMLGSFARHQPFKGRWFISPQQVAGRGGWGVTWLAAMPGWMLWRNAYRLQSCLSIYGDAVAPLASGRAWAKHQVPKPPRAAHAAGSPTPASPSALAAGTVGRPGAGRAQGSAGHGSADTTGTRGPAAAELPPAPGAPGSGAQSKPPGSSHKPRAGCARFGPKLLAARHLPALKGQQEAAGAGGMPSGAACPSCLPGSSAPPPPLI